jgi:hypothetical protein
VRLFEGCPGVKRMNGILNEIWMNGGGNDKNNSCQGHALRGNRTPGGSS